MGGAAAVIHAATLRRAAEIAGKARERMERVVRDAAPVSPGYPGAERPGRLRDSVEVSVRRGGDGFTFTVRATAEHAIFTVVPTRPHVIRAQGRGVLAFWWPEVGGMAFFPHVDHPGTTPSGWWERALGRFPEVLRDAQ
jgi:bacteriophage HK97-gp10 putative tail-component